MNILLGQGMLGLQQFNKNSQGQHTILPDIQNNYDFLVNFFMFSQNNYVNDEW